MSRPPGPGGQFVEGLHAGADIVAGMVGAHVAPQFEHGVRGRFDDRDRVSHVVQTRCDLRSISARASRSAQARARSSSPSVTGPRMPSTRKFAGRRARISVHGVPDRRRDKVSYVGSVPIDSGVLPCLARG